MVGILLPVAEQPLELFLARPAADDAAPLVVVGHERGDFALGEPRSRLDVVPVTLSEHPGDLGAVAAVHEVGERSAGFDRGQLAGISGQHELPAGPVGVLGQRKQLPRADHARLVDQHDAPLFESATGVEVLEQPGEGVRCGLRPALDLVRRYACEGPANDRPVLLAPHLAGDGEDLGLRASRGAAQGVDPVAGRHQVAYGRALLFGEVSPFSQHSLQSLRVAHGTPGAQTFAHEFLQAHLAGEHVPGGEQLLPGRPRLVAAHLQNVLPVRHEPGGELLHLRHAGAAPVGVRPRLQRFARRKGRAAARHAPKTGDGRRGGRVVDGLPGARPAGRLPHHVVNLEAHLVLEFLRLGPPAPEQRLGLDVLLLAARFEGRDVAGPAAAPHPLRVLDQLTLDLLSQSGPLGLRDLLPGGARRAALPIHRRLQLCSAGLSRRG